MKKTIYFPIMICAMSLATATVKAQTITFDEDDYKAVSVYDSWADSPFMTGELQGNVAVIDNCLTDTMDALGYAPNTTPKIVGMQRSRYGSNLMGIRVDLKETFRLTKEARYVHVMVNRPKSGGRVMLITLGKRSEREGQSEDVEQTWSLTSASVGVNGWYDALFSIKGFSYDDESQDGIDIYSLVICPDVTDRSTMDEDFICYIDQIEIDDKATARFNASYYPISFSTSTEVTRTDRYVSSVSLSGGSFGTQTYSGLQSLIYNDGTKEPVVFTAVPGETLQPLFSYTGSYMDGYVYVDWGQDGQFSAEVNDDGTIVDGSDLVSYDGYMINSTWYNSNGETEANGNRIGSGVPKFTVPEGTEPGLYRMRYKVDWNCIDPAGNTNENNLLVDNGGGIVDVMLNVCPAQADVTASQLNGDIYPADDLNTPLQNYKVQRGESLRIKVVPAPGFTYSGIRVRCGYDLEGDSVVRDNPQYFDTYFKAAQFVDDELTLPAELLAYAEVQIEGYMVSDRYLTLVDEEVENPTLESLTLTGVRERTYEIADNTHSLQDLTGETWVPVPAGSTFSSSVPGDLYVDFNRDGQYSLVTEALDATLESDLAGGIYHAVLDCDPYQFLFLINIAPEKTDVKVNSLNGRLIGRQSHPDGEDTNKSTGVPEQVAPFYFLGLVAQPLVDGYACSEATVRRGYNLDGDQFSTDGIQQWSEYTITIPETGYVNLAQDSVYGSVIVTADFEESGEDTDFELAFSDEFDAEELDASKWTTRERANATWNRFISTDPRVAYLDDGSLVCRAIANDDLTTDNAAMLTGAKQTSNSYGLLYGYVEVRAITKPHSGNFPAIWMMPMDQSDGWPTCGEIDIWECINTSNSNYHTVHSYWTKILGYTGKPSSTTNETYNMDGEWHTYGLLKEPGKLTWYVDGTKVFSYAKSTSESDLEQGQWPFDKEFYLILNQSVGDGSWASNYDSSFTYETRFDWARFYTNNAQTGVSSVRQAGSVDSRIYDLSGRQVSRPQRGVYIKGGKKIIY